MSRLVLGLFGLASVYCVADLVRPATVNHLNQVQTVLSDVNSTIIKELP